MSSTILGPKVNSKMNEQTCCVLITQPGDRKLKSLIKILKKTLKIFLIVEVRIHVVEAQRKASNST